MPNRIEACRIEIRGIVQGVGFRPFVYQVASSLSIRGWVRNDSHGVTVHAEGTRERINGLLDAVRTGAPAAARIESLESTGTEPEGHADFQIRPSAGAPLPTAKISPDLPTCSDCLDELLDAGSRRYLYPYINCTACGPRYSIVRSLPYDRPNTTMCGWPLCAECQSEYDDPTNRRHHAQPTACNRCGPHYRLIVDGEDRQHRIEAIQQASAFLASGKILAVKGVGGYHLACNARDSAAVTRLRERKFRKEKPFAVMVRDLNEAHTLAYLTQQHVALLTDCARPIVLASARQSLFAVAPDTDQIGIMLPYAPLHELLFHFGAPSPLLLTSANRSSEPIAYQDTDALDRLSGLADAFLIGERPIARRVDDSVVAVRNGRPAMIRRARGYAPRIVAHLPTKRPILALGADLKNSIALVLDGDVIASQHIGDLGDLETDRALAETTRDFLTMYEIPESDLIVAHDLHPEYVSTRYAQSLSCHRRIAVQHHRAHIASVLAEQEDLSQNVVGVSLDGTGYGDDGTIWGCEIFAGSVTGGLQRVAHLRGVGMPGGDAASRYPVQAAAGFLVDIETPDLRRPPFSFPERFDQARQLSEKDVRCFPSSSAGRLFDAVAALCGFTREISFEGQAAIWLEHQAHQANQSQFNCEPYPFPDLDHRRLLRSIVDDRLAGRDVSQISLSFHKALASSLRDVVQRIADRHQTDNVVCSGGVFQNRLLASLLTESAVQHSNLRFRFNESVPTNDGGIALGQAAIASAIVES